MEYPKLFEPITIGKVEIKNRVAMAPMGALGLVSPDGCFTNRAVDYYVERAKGGTGLIITSIVKAENEIEQLKMPSFPCTTINPVHFIQTATELTERVHAYGAKIFIQLSMGMGRSGAPAFLVGQPVAPSAIPDYWDPKVTCHELTTQEVETMVKKFGESAQIAVESGFDGIEVHAVHEGYLLDQFTIAMFNRRTDKYGGDIHGRLTLPTEIVREIKSKAGCNFPVGVRFSIKSQVKGWRQGGLPGEDFVEMGRTVEEGLVVAKLLEEAGYDELNADCGTYDAWYWAHPPGYFEHGCYLPYVEKLRGVVKIPVLMAGRMEIPELAEKALEEDKADMVELGRGLLTEPCWVKKVMEHRESEIRPCIGCHVGCLGRVFEDKPLCCAVNPAVGRERIYGLEPAKKPRRVMIVGGGVAGMEAARAAAERGHVVTLFEKSSRLGGHVIGGSVPDFKADDKKLLEWYENQMHLLKVNVKMSCEVTEEVVSREKADVVIIATGSSPAALTVPGISDPKVVGAEDVLLGNKNTGKTVVVIGGGLVGCETALYLAKQGKAVTVVEMLGDLLISGRTVPHMNRIMLIDLLKFHQVTTMTKTLLLEVNGQGAVVLCGSCRKYLPAESIVVSAGYRPDDALYRRLSGKIPELYRIGDARDAGTIMTAIWEAYEIGRSV
ncbi:MAG: FAD-dependent oxidoreductase [Clostridia bacterium]|nr:FAD-dependent oxidoreductase [Clostridia bacterium]